MALLQKMTGPSIMERSKAVHQEHRRAGRSAQGHTGEPQKHSAERRNQAQSTA